MENGMIKACLNLQRQSFLGPKSDTTLGRTRIAIVGLGAAVPTLLSSSHMWGSASLFCLIRIASRKQTLTGW
jgi:hypothetical protein